MSAPPAARRKADFDPANFSQVVSAYNQGTADTGLPADAAVARSLIGPASGALRDFSYIAPEIPRFIPANCVGCMDCVTECPDTAILAKVHSRATLDTAAAKAEGLPPEEFLADWAVTAKYHKSREKKGQEPGLFGIYIDPTKCKGCAECVTVCGEKGALEMVDKAGGVLARKQAQWDFYRALPETPAEFIVERSLADMMLAERSLLFVGGAGSCMGCGEATAIRMVLAATGYVYGTEKMGIVNSTGCSTVYGSSYPYNPYRVPWTNSLFENGPTDAMGVRAKWDQAGHTDRKLWVFGGDGAMLDIGFQALSRMLMSGMDINVLVLDTQVYSNTGGQASTSTFRGQNTKMSAHGKVLAGKQEGRKELALIAMMHPEVFVAQTTAAHANHFYKAVLAANEYPGPALINCYTTCQPEHGVGDNMSSTQAKLAADTRTFPVFTYDPRQGETLAQRLDLRGNPAPDKDWYVNPKTGEPLNFITFARTEDRFGKHFDRDGNPSETLLQANEERLANWRLLQELAGVKR